MLFSTKNYVFGRTILIDTNDILEVVPTAQKITRTELGWGPVVPVTINTLDEQDDCIAVVEAWWGEWCDHAENNNNVSDADFDATLRLMKKTFAEVFSAW